MEIRRKIKVIATVLVVFTLSISVHYLWDAGQAYETFYTLAKYENTTKYIIDAVFEEEDMTVKGKQKIMYQNTSDSKMKNIYFHIYTNAFKDEKSAPFEKSEMERAYPNGFDPGWINIKNIRENNKKINHKVMGKDNTNLRVTPKNSLQPGDIIELTIEFQVKLPNAMGRTGYGENTVNITDWYPILAVMDNDGWNLDPYYSIGDPFYSEVATYDVTMTIPSNYELATTGNIIKTSNKDKTKTYKIQENNIRDFAMILSSKFSIDRSEVDDIEIISYTIDGAKKEEALEYTRDSIKIFNDLFGKYPYKQISTVASDFFIGGMEYPNLVMIGQTVYEMKEDFPLEYIIAHEIAHQWWYGIVGNNQVKEPWLDEALTEYATLLYFEEKYGPHIKEQVYEKMIEYQYNEYIKSTSNKDESILKGVNEFKDSFEYSSVIYSKGAIFIKELRQEMGDQAFFKALKEYYESYKFKNATSKDFMEILQNNSKDDLKPEFSKWLNMDIE